MRRASRALVIGGCGFIGSHIVDRMVAAGYKVSVVDDLSTGSLANIRNALASGHVEFAHIDAFFLREQPDVFRSCDVIVNCAVSCVRRSLRFPLQNSQVNAQLALELLTCANRHAVPMFIQLSTSEIYGNHGVASCSEDVIPRPTTIYAVAKRSAEMYCEVFKSLYGMDVRIIRAFNAFGPRAPIMGVRAEVIPRFIAALSSSESVHLHAGGLTQRDFTFVTDIAEGVFRLIESSNKFDVVNLGFGQAHSIMDVYRSLCSLMGIDHKSRAQVGEERPGEVDFLEADITRLRSLLNWSPTISLEEGLRILLSDKDEILRLRELSLVGSERW